MSESFPAGYSWVEAFELSQDIGINTSSNVAAGYEIDILMLTAALTIQPPSPAI